MVADPIPWGEGSRMTELPIAKYTNAGKELDTIESDVIVLQVGARDAL